MHIIRKSQSILKLILKHKRPEHMQYKNDIWHYQKDAEFNNYFKNNLLEDHNIGRRYGYIFDWIDTNDKGSILEIGSS
jgi:hypothetical protein